MVEMYERDNNVVESEEVADVAGVGFYFIS